MKCHKCGNVYGLEVVEGGRVLCRECVADFPMLTATPADQITKVIMIQADYNSMMADAARYKFLRDRIVNNPKCVCVRERGSEKSVELNIFLKYESCVVDQVMSTAEILNAMIDSAIQKENHE